jgi:adenine-specific DNA-methyltransferase
MFNIQNRRYLGNKYKLLDYIGEIIEKECGETKTICDIFSGTGVVGLNFNNKKTSIIANDILSSSFACLNTFLLTNYDYQNEIVKKINTLNNVKPKDNYFSKNFGDTYFSLENARKIGEIREKINRISDSKIEKNILLCSLLYATDKVANTVGHYDSYRKKLDSLKPIRLLVPNIDWQSNKNNKVYKKDANELIKDIKCDVLYIDPPYNSRQYSDTYHLLENLINWEKPEVKGKAKKMDRSSLKSKYCLKEATEAFCDLVSNAKCKYILVSYNNTGESKDDRSNARIKDEDIIKILKSRGKTKVFEKYYPAFTTGRSNSDGHTERVFYCKIEE